MVDDYKLSPRQIERLAECIRGNTDDDVFEYRTHAMISTFFEFCGCSITAPDEEEGSRPSRTESFIRRANASGDIGDSGLTEDIERVLRALLDCREFNSDTAHQAAIDWVNEEVLQGIPVTIKALNQYPYISVVRLSMTPGQESLERQIHTVFDSYLKNDDLQPARHHYLKARRYLKGPESDYANAAKEAVSSVESLLCVLTGESRFNKALSKAVKEGVIRRPLDQVITKVYAFRGAEPGVAHGQDRVPSVTRLDAELVFNLSASIGVFLRNALSDDE